MNEEEKGIKDYINLEIKYCLGILRNTKYSGHMQDKYKLQGRLETLREIKGELSKNDKSK